MTITNIPGADEKNAKLSLKLRADSGYSATSDGHLVSANQWAAIISICEDTKTGKALMAAPELLEFAQTFAVCMETDTFGDRDNPSKLYEQAVKAIRRATGATS